MARPHGHVGEGRRDGGGQILQLVAQHSTTRTRGRAHGEEPRSAGQQWKRGAQRRRQPAEAPRRRARETAVDRAKRTSPRPFNAAGPTPIAPPSPSSSPSDDLRGLLGREVHNSAR